jgi:putative transposase
MARMRRVMFEGVPFHLTHRGNHKKIVFCNDEERRLYLDLLGRYATQFGMLVWGFCLMDNHVHIIAVGNTPTSIPRALGNAHREFSRKMNRVRGITGHLWANRFFSTMLDEPHLWAAIRYVELNPVRAGVVDDATRYEWSSARVHADLTQDKLLDPDRPFPGPIGGWLQWLKSGLEDETIERLRRNTASGEPTGNGVFVTAIERRLGRSVRPGRKRAGG